MSKIEKQLIDILETIEGNGSFVTSGQKKLIVPGMNIDGIGEVGFPLNQIQIDALIKTAHKAPFGKGSQTITDSTVRSAWEIDAEKISFHNEDWEKFIQDVLKKVKKGLGIGKKEVSAELYKLLIYEEGDFFLAHKDSEKQKGMFASLVIGLPSKHSGAELIIRFDGMEEIVDFSTAADSYKIQFAAFYADCEHEIRPVTSGHRMTLVYNLLQSSESADLSSPQFSSQVNEMAVLLDGLESSFADEPKAVLLGHQYTPANFSQGQLKHHDQPRAEALLEAVDKAGYMARLALVTCYQSGDLEGVGYGYDYHDYDISNATMGEIYEQYTQIEYWSDDELPTLGNISLDEEGIITQMEIGEGDPIAEEADTYTGNAGMTMEYWYHYGAVILWPKSKHLHLILDRPKDVRLKWLECYVKICEDSIVDSKEYAEQLILSFVEEDLSERHYDTPDFSAVADALTNLKDKIFLKKNCTQLLAQIFERIKLENWTSLLQNYDTTIFIPIFRLAADTDDVFVINHILQLLRELKISQSEELQSFASDRIGEIPDYLQKVQVHQLKESGYSFNSEENRKKTIKSIVENLLVLSSHQESDNNWMKRTIQSITRSLPRKYVNKVLCPILITGEYREQIVAKSLYQICRTDLISRTNIKPSPPGDWEREVPKSKNFEDKWEILRPFLESKTQQIFDYAKNQSYRKDMEYAIKSVTIDLKMETIRKGSPHTLRLTKTQAAYERSLKKWEVDVELLKRLRESGD